MIGFHEIDMMVRGGSLGLILLWSWLLFRDYRHALAGRMAIAMNASIICHVIATIPGTLGPSVGELAGPPSYLGLIDWVAELGSVSVPPLFWLFARAWFNDEQRFGWLSWAAVPFSMALIPLVDLNYAERNLVFQVSAMTLRISMFAFGVAGLWVAWRGREGDLVEVRRQLRVKMLAAVGLLVLLTNAVEIAVFQGVIANAWRSLLQLAILSVTFAFCATMFGIRLPDLLGAGHKVDDDPANIAPASDDPIVQRLLAHMDTEMPHRDETLTIASLARQLGLQEYQLRRLINGTLGYRNFAQFLNRYRLAEVKAALSDESQRDVPILTIALDAGFGSLGPFNRAFRDAEGMTPSAFRARTG